MANRQRAALRPPVMAPQATPAPQKSYQSPSRAGKRGVTFYLPEDEWRRLRVLSVNTDVPIQELMAEAVGLLFNRHRQA
jgi:hypothetical protein